MIGAKVFPKKRPFYGWLIVGMAVAANFVPSGFSQVFTGIVLKPISQDMGWTRTMTTGAIAMGGIGSGLISPFVGWLTDRYGARFLMPVGALISAGAFVALAQITSLWQFYVAYVLGRAVSGPMMGGVVAFTTVVNWFRRRRGIVIGMVAMSLPLWGSAQTFLAQSIISFYGWRTIYWIFGAVALFLMVLPPILIIRRRPEDIGLLPDGDESLGEDRVDSPSHGKGRRQAAEFDWSFGEAFRTRSLWHINVAQTVQAAAIGGVVFHLVAYLTDVGIPQTAAGVALSLFALFGAFANIFWGFLSDRLSARACNIFVLFVSGVMVGVLLTVRNAPMAYLFATLFGLTARGEGTLVEIMLAQYYGRASFGSIVGFLGPFHSFSLGLGPLAAAAAFDLTGSYQGVFMVFAGFYLFACLNMILATRPKLPTRAVSPSMVGDGSEIKP